MRIFNMLTLGLLLSFAMVSVASAHCGSCGTKKEKAHTHDKKDGKHEHKKDQNADGKVKAEEKSCDDSKAEAPAEKKVEAPAEKKAETPTNNK